MKHYPRPFVSFHPNAVKIFFYNGVVTRLSSWKAIDRSLLPWHHNRPVPDSQDATVCKQHIFPRLFYALFVLWIFPLFVFILSCQWKTKIMLFRGLESKEFIVNSKNSKEILELLKYSAKKYHQTLILITHDLAIAKEADRVITIADGEIIGNEVNK